MLQVSADMPATQLFIASLELGLQNLEAAEKAYLHALKIEPNFVPALLNLADYYRLLGREDEVEPLLKTSLQVAPDSGAANHSYGLYLVRKRQYTEALVFLENATNSENAQPHFAYVYAIALESAGNIDSAITVLEKVNSRWHNQYEILLALVIFLDKTRGSPALYQHLASLTKIAPGSAQVQQFVQKYGK